MVKSFFKGAIIGVAAAVLSMLGWNSAAGQTAKDWAQFGRFQESNRQIKAQMSKCSGCAKHSAQTKTDTVQAINYKGVILLGNSITELWQKLHPEFFTENGFLSRGISGQTSYQMLLRFREDVINLRPKVVVINAGTNDIAENNHPYVEDRTLGNIISMCELAKANNIKVILTTITPCGFYIWRKDITDAVEKIESLNKRIAEYADKNDIPFVDYFTPMAVAEGDKRGWMKEELTKDGCHPTLAGYAIMEPLILEAVGNSLK